MKNKIKIIFKGRSKLLLIFTLAEIIIAIIMTLGFVYSDSLNYTDSAIYETTGVNQLLESMYSSTLWGLIIFMVDFISIFSLTAFIYKKLDYEFISILLWAATGITAINIGNTIKTNIATLFLFIPIIVIGIIAYKNQKYAMEKEQIENEQIIKEKKTTKKHDK